VCKGGTSQPGHGVDQLTFGVRGDLVRLQQRQIIVDDQVGLGVQPVGDPPHPHRRYVTDARHGAQRRLRLIDQARVDGVHQPPVHLPCRVLQHGRDRRGDAQAGHRVGPPPAQRHPAGPDQHRQRGEPVGAGVQPVGNQPPTRSADSP
jgi:hypothetical protein